MEPGNSENKKAHGEDVSRTQFMQYIAGAFAAIWGSMTLYPLYLYLKPPENQSDETKVASVIVCATAELPVGTGKNFKFGSIPAVVTHTKDGQFHAFNAICTHLGCTVQFRPDRDLIWCACHGGCYNPESGKNVSGPPPKPLAPLKVAIVDGKIVVSRA